jgi:hypothetical protein
MGAETVMTADARFSILRYVPDAGRDEPRNVAVVLFGPNGYRGMRAIPPSAIASRLRDQGLMDRLLSSMATRIGSSSLELADMYRWRSTWSHALQLSEPRSTAIVGSPPDTLTTIYKALVGTPARRSKRHGKAEVLDRVVSAFRKRGANVRRSDYIQDFVFDAVVESDGEPPRTFAAISFATGAADWSSVEKDAGHFLFAASRVDATPTAIVQQPVDSAATSALKAHEKVRRWFDKESVAVVDLDGLESLAAKVAPLSSPPEPLVLHLFGD